MSCRRLALAVGLFLSSTSSYFSAQAIRQEQEEDKPLLSANLVIAGDPLGTANILVGLSSAYPDTDQHDP